MPAACTTSASAEPTPEPTSSCSPRTSTFASSTPSPASSSANYNSTQPSTTSHKTRPENSDLAGSAVADVLRDHTAEGVGFEPTMTLPRHSGFQDRRHRPLGEPSRPPRYGADERRA